MNHEELRARVAEALAENKGPVMPASLAGRFGVTELEAVRALPDEMRAFAPASAFNDIWDGLTTWPNATIIIQHMGCVFEIKSALVRGKHGHGYFNLFGDVPLGGHLKLDELDCVCFLSMPFMGRESHSVQFFHSGGEVMFSIYAGRENHQLIPAARDSFLALKEKFGKA
mgnify:CR=1 FL=1